MARVPIVVSFRQQIAAILAGADDRLLVVVGPCSIHDPVAAEDYAKSAATVAARLAPDLLIPTNPFPRALPLSGEIDVGDQPIVVVRHGLVQCGGAPVGGLPFTSTVSVNLRAR